jgi:hypothetical protein
MLSIQELFARVFIGLTADFIHKKDPKDVKKPAKAGV